MIETAKALMLQYDFRTAIPLAQAVRDYINPTIKDEQVNKSANAGEYPFPCYKADPNNKKSAWFVSVESLAKWLDSRKIEAEKDHLAMHG